MALAAAFFASALAVRAFSAELVQQAIATPVPGVDVGVLLQVDFPGPWAVEGHVATWQIRDSVGMQSAEAGEVIQVWPDKTLVPRLRERMIWQPPYLVLERRCSGTALTCGGKTVFKVRDGRAQRIGYLPGGDAVFGPARDSIGPRIEAIYDRLERGFSGLSHAGSPVLVLILRDENDHLVLDRAATCANQTNHKPIPEANPGGGELYFSQLAKAALVDKYCDRTALLAATMATAELKLRPGDYRELVAALARVQPFEVPYQ